MDNLTNKHPSSPVIDAVLLLDDGTRFYGKGVGKQNVVSGELCFNTAITGYQEILTDSSYSDQIITFTFPHIGNVGTNSEDSESLIPVVSGLVLRNNITLNSNFRSTNHFEKWLQKNEITGITGIDTRALVQHIRKNGAQNAVICYNTSSKFDIDYISRQLHHTPSHTGLELASKVSNTFNINRYINSQLAKQPIKEIKVRRCKVVIIDFGVKLATLSYLQTLGCDLVVVPAKSSFNEIISYRPDGILLSNGPGDPVATIEYFLPVLQKLIEESIPIFGICLGHQLLALALNAKIEKMHHGHRGANHPVKDLATGKIHITSQNHGFVVKKENLPSELVVTHVSLFDNSIEGLKHKDKPIFSVQFHPEASPGPMENLYLFRKFLNLIAGYDDQREAGNNKV